MKLGSLNVNKSTEANVAITPRDGNGKPMITDTTGAEVALVLRAPQPSDLFSARKIATELLKEYPDWDEQYAMRVATIGVCHVSPEPDEHPATWYAKLDESAGDILLFIIGQFEEAFPARLSVGQSEAIRSSKND